MSNVNPSATCAPELAADRVGLLQHRDVVPRGGQAQRGGEAADPRADDGDPHAARLQRRRRPSHARAACATRGASRQRMPWARDHCPMAGTASAPMQRNVATATSGRPQKTRCATVSPSQVQA